MPNTEIVSLPSLRIFKLEYVIFPSDWVFELLISQSLLLERLTVKQKHEDNLKILYVHSKSFLSLCFVGLQEFDIDEVVTLWIDAPKLHYLSIVRDATNWFKTKGFGALVKLDLDTNFNLTSSDLKSDDISKGSSHTLLKWRETIV
ncbi:unnamed protein product [Arabis nemorensis]|uniref:Uncharacterized protein n=1 Tax=Arabis nemorensis TaxID=586526 RepID=A0A565B370_9BRAS|nr:unnamed protein product [Arabis nemorensis]